MTVTFDDEPIVTRWEAVAAQLRAQPGCWAWIDDVTPSSVRGTAYNIRKGYLPAFRPVGAYQAHQVRGRLRARYIGPAGEHAHGEHDPHDPQ